MSQFKEELLCAEKPALPALPNYAFDPRDSWTVAFQNGLRHLNVKGKVVYEVGVGTGSNVVFLLEHCRARKVYGSDLDERLAEVAYQTVSARLPSGLPQFHPLRGSVSLIDTPEASHAARTADLIIACIPQAVDLEEESVASFIQSWLPGVPAQARQPDHHAHYYPYASFRHYQFNRFGLGLNEALLDSARQHAPGVPLLLNLSGRIGLERILGMIRHHHFQPSVVFQTIVPQCQKTSIAYYAALEAYLEQQGVALNSEFFLDAEGTQQISARQAKQFRLTDPDIALFHSLYVVEARPNIKVPN